MLLFIMYIILECILISISLSRVSAINCKIARHVYISDGDRTDRNCTVRSSSRASRGVEKYICLPLMILFLYKTAVPFKCNFTI